MEWTPTTSRRSGVAQRNTRAHAFLWRHHPCGGEQGVWPSVRVPQHPEGYEAAGLDCEPFDDNQGPHRGAWRSTPNVQPMPRGRGKGDGALSRNGHIAGIPSMLTS